MNYIQYQSPDLLLIKHRPPEFFETRNLDGSSLNSRLGSGFQPTLQYLVRKKTLYILLARLRRRV